MSLIPVGFGNWLPPASGHIITVQWSQFGKQKPSYPWHPRLNRFFGHVQKQFSVENEVANSCYITVIPGGAESCYIPSYGGGIPGWDSQFPNHDEPLLTIVKPS